MDIDNDLIIKKNNLFIIYKNIKSGTYILSTNNLIIIHFTSKNDFLEFEYLYDNIGYLFNVYTNGKHYYIICVSKYKKDNYYWWLKANDCTKKYLHLSKKYNSFLIMNTSNSKFKTSIYNYTFIKCIGKGLVSFEINNLVKYYINFINNSYLPHYKKSLI